MFTSSKPTAKILDKRLVLSLPDAVTPVTWMMDLKEEGTFILKIDQNENGFFVLQKISKEGKKTEDIAYYAKQNDAKRAMNLMTQVSGQKVTTPASLIWRIIRTLVFVVALVFVCAVLYFNRDIFFGMEIQQQAVNTAQQRPNVVVSEDPNAVGVPMSADDFLNQPSNRLPF